MKRGLGALVLAIAMLVSARASAQIHWDASAQVGVEKRVLDGGSGSGPGFGPAAQVSAHVALLPLVRVGAWLAQDISPMPSPIAARDITTFGLRGKLMSPLPTGNLHPYLFAGFGYAIMYARSYHTTLSLQTGIPGQTGTPTDALVNGAGGSFFDVPVGIGASYKLWRAIALVAELGVHIGFGHSGSNYEGDGPNVTVPNRPDESATPSGLDRYGFGLTVGLLLDL